MIAVTKYDKNEGQVYFHAKGNDFHESISLFKNCKLKYNPSTKKWTATPKKALHVMSEAKEFMIPCQVSDDILQEIEKNKNKYGKQETNFQRNALNWDQIPFTPIEGKSPYENFQINSIKRGISQNRIAYFLGMGTGKTAITIGVLNHRFNWGDVDRLLIVAPPEGVVNWKRELLRFSTFVSDPSEILISSANHNRDFLEQDYKVIILTYRHFLTVSDDYYKKIKGGKAKKYRTPVIPFEQWGTNRAIVLDESHAIKNPQSRTSHVIHLHRDSFLYRYCLTGTPSPNDFTELYSQMKFLDPGILPYSYQDWIEEIANIGNSFSKYAINFLYDFKVEEWESRFKPYVLRLKTEDVLDLPQLYVKPIYVELSERQRFIYQELVNQEVTVLKEQDGMIIPKKLISRFPYISQALDNPELLKGKVSSEQSSDLHKVVNKFQFERDHNKVDVLKSLVDKHISIGEKIIIFDYHPVTLEQIYSLFPKYNPIMIHGQNIKGTKQDISNEGETSKKRDIAIEEFKNRDNCKLLVASSKVMTTSINLQKASVAIYFSRSYSYLEWSQTLARLYRIGQDKPVTIYPLIFEKSLDVALDKSLNNKQDLDKNLFSRKLKNKQTLSLGEWKEFFRGE